MVILDAPYASDMLLSWLEESQHPVLTNCFTRSIDGFKLNLVDDATAISLIDSGQRVYTNSENALAWIMENTHADSLKHGISVFKDKLEMRRVLKDLDKNLFFKECAADELAVINYSELPETIVLKPAVGFCSMGVYVINNAQEWQNALEDIKRDSARWQQMYPDSVVNAGRFIIEDYICGQEYAIDAFFDSQGKVHVLNVLKHDFASAEDTSDRMYTTGADIYAQMAPVFTDWLQKVNEVVRVRDFPIHVEVRVNGQHVSPIEFNPMRFAGLGGTDVSQYAFGFKTYQAYLDNAIPDMSAYKLHTEKVFTMSLLNPPAGTDGTENFDYDAFIENFQVVHEMRKFDVSKVGNYGFLFIETTPDSSELDFLMHDDLSRFIEKR
ncbi:ATP-grasp domain-containing protein [Adlercreutzia sp. ZJ154]|uniref:ATP-grasp domain-containing protein n=1 Tax=Adlercreutzia sp. ZJ154 TaxID=2709790 RepID=UPI0013ED0D38|nr:ATP-grasp domain-containing protein [Adlercreutzia sp. ZJ154]